jgi:hypothetical protein
MERKAHALQVKRLAARAAAAEKQRLAFGAAWATLSYADGAGFRVEALHEDRATAQAIARAETQQALDAGTFVPDAPYRVVFPAPVMLDQGYLRGKAYYAVLRTAASRPASRTVALYASEAEAEAAAGKDADGERAYVGGPVELPVEHPEGSGEAAAAGAPHLSRAARRELEARQKRAKKKEARALAGQERAQKELESARPKALTSGC